MKCGDESGKLRLLDVLEFVNQNDDGLPRSLRGLTDCFEESRQVSFKVAVIGQPWLRVKIEADLDVLVLKLECSDKPSEASLGALR